MISCIFSLISYRMFGIVTCIFSLISYRMFGIVYLQPYLVSYVWYRVSSALSYRMLGIVYLQPYLVSYVWYRVSSALSRIVCSVSCILSLISYRMFGIVYLKLYLVSYVWYRVSSALFRIVCLVSSRVSSALSRIVCLVSCIFSLISYRMPHPGTAHPSLSPATSYLTRFRFCSLRRLSRLYSAMQTPTDNRMVTIKTKKSPTRSSRDSLSNFRLAGFKLSSRHPNEPHHLK